MVILFVFRFIKCEYNFTKTPKTFYYIFIAYLSPLYNTIVLFIKSVILYLENVNKCFNVTHEGKY